jgi:fluoride exporter
MNLTTCLIVMAGGALGALARYLVAATTLPISTAMPWGTMIINVTGSLLIGFFGTLTLASGRYPAPDSVRLFVMVGLCGGYTTFSAFSLQTFDLLRAGGYARATANAVLSVVLCLAAVAAGHAIASHLNGGAREVAQSAMEEEA